MAVATQKCSVPSLPARPAGKGCPRKRERGVNRREVGEKEGEMETERRWEKRGGKGLNERRESSEVGGVPGAHSSAISGGPTVQWNEKGSMHLSKPRRGLRQWESLSRILPSLLPPPSSILHQASPDIYLAVRQERQCKSNPPPINYLFHSPFSSLSSSSTPFCLPPIPLFACYPCIPLPPFLPAWLPSTCGFPLQYKLGCQRGSCDVANLPL